jgi:hypothetical protein
MRRWNFCLCYELHFSVDGIMTCARIQFNSMYFFFWHRPQGGQCPLLLLHMNVYSIRPYLLLYVRPMLPYARNVMWLDERASSPWGWCPISSPNINPSTEMGHSKPMTTIALATLSIFFYLSSTADNCRLQSIEIYAHHEQTWSINKENDRNIVVWKEKQFDVPVTFRHVTN